MNDFDSAMESPQASSEFVDVDELLDEAYLLYNQGETKLSLERLEELIDYCELAGIDIPPEAEQLYEESLEEWFIISIDEEDE